MRTFVPPEVVYAGAMSATVPVWFLAVYLVLHSPVLRQRAAALVEVAIALGATGAGLEPEVPLPAFFGEAGVGEEAAERGEEAGIGASGLDRGLGHARGLPSRRSRRSSAACSVRS